MLLPSLMILSQTDPTVVEKIVKLVETNKRLFRREVYNKKEQRPMCSFERSGMW